MMQTVLYWSFREFFRLYSKVFLILIIKGNSSVKGPCIYIANHPNVFDPMYLLPRIGRRVTVMITEHAFLVPIFGSLLRFTRQLQVPLPSGSVYKETLRRLRQGESILMFPEGDCNEGKSVLPFHTGAVRLAIEANVPIVPIGIYLDPVKVWKRETIIGNAKIVFTWYRMGWYGITYGERISLEGKVEERNFIRHKTVELHTIVEKLARESKKMCKLAIYQGKRKAKRRFHTALRFAYRFVCFLIFTKIHMYVL